MNKQYHCQWLPGELFLGLFLEPVWHAQTFFKQKHPRWYSQEKQQLKGVI